LCGKNINGDNLADHIRRCAKRFRKENIEYLKSLGISEEKIIEVFN